MKHDAKLIEKIVTEQDGNITNSMKKYVEYEIAENRNALGTITTLIDMLEDDNVEEETITKLIPMVKSAVNRIAHREVFDKLEISRDA